MYQLDEKLMSDTRAIVAISRNKATIEPQLKPGMLNYTHDTKDLYTVIGEGHYKRILQEDEDGKVHGDMHFAGNVTIDKNLIVKGDSTELITQELIVEDNVIILNKGETGNGITEGESGIQIDRGLSDAAFMLFKEQSDREATNRFIFGTGENIYGTFYSDGDLKLKKDLIAEKGLFNHDISTKQNLVVDKTALIKGTLTVEQASILKNTLLVKDNATLEKALTVKGATTVEGLKVNQNILAAGASNTFTGEVEIIGDVHANENITISKNATVSGNLNVVGATTVNSLTANKADVTTITTNSVTTEALSVNQNANIKNNLTVEGTTSLQALNAKATTATALTVNGRTILKDHAITETLQVKGDMVAGANCSVEDNFTVYGSSVLGNTHITDILNVDNNIVTRQQMLAQILGVTGNGEIGGNLTVRGKINVTGGIDIGGSIEATSLTLSSNLTVGGNATINGSMDVNRDITANTITARSKMLTPEITSSTIYLSASKNTMLQETQEEGLNESLLGNATLTLNETGFLVKQPNKNIMHILKDKARFNVPVQIKSGSKWGTVLDNVTGHKALHSVGGTDRILPSDIAAIENAGAVPSIQSGTDASKPLAGKVGRVYIATDVAKIYRDNGSVWQAISSTDWGSIEGIPDTFKPPIATKTKLGGIIVGEGLDVTPTGILSVRDPERDLVVNRQEFTATANQKLFTLDTPYEIGTNSVSIYVFGKLLPPSAFIERTQSSVELREGVEQGSHIEIVTTLIPKKSSISIVREEIVTKANQTEFTLTKGYYEMGNNSLRIYVYGQFLPPSAFEEITQSSFRLKQAPQQGAIMVVEYMNKIIHNEAMRIEESKEMPQRLVHVQHDASDNWIVVHGLKKYPDFVIIGEKGMKLQPKTVQYVTVNRAILTFDDQITGKVYC